MQDVRDICDEVRSEQKLEVKVISEKNIPGRENSKQNHQAEATSHMSGGPVELELLELRESREDWEMR